MTLIWAEDPLVQKEPNCDNVFGAFSPIVTRAFTVYKSLHKSLHFGSIRGNGNRKAGTEHVECKPNPCYI